MPSCFLFKNVPGSSLNAFGSTPGGIPVWKYPLGLDLVDCSFVHWRYLVDFRLGKKRIRDRCRPVSYIRVCQACSCRRAPGWDCVDPGAVYRDCSISRWIYELEFHDGRICQYQPDAVFSLNPGHPGLEYCWLMGIGSLGAAVIRLSLETRQAI